MSEITKDRTNALRTEPFARLFFYRQNEDFQVALYLLILLNLNEDEVSGIKWDDIDFQKRQIRIKDGEVSLTSDICNFLYEFRTRKLVEYYEKGILNHFCYVCSDANGNRISGDRLSKDFKSYLELYGYESLTPQEIHSTFPEYLYKNDMVTKIIRMYLENSRTQLR